MSQRMLLVGYALIALIGFVSWSPIDQFVSGNVQLLKCINTILISDDSSTACIADEGTVAQQKAMIYLNHLQMWQRGSYQELAAMCGNTLCACAQITTSDELTLPDALALHERMQIYLSVLAYRLETGGFPLKDTCTTLFIPSEYLVYQSSNTPDREQAGILLDMAYWIDNEWESHWQRGITIYEIAARYRDQGNFAASHTAFELALESLPLASDEKALFYTSWGYQALGDLARQDEDWTSAEDSYRKAVAASPEVSTPAFRGLVEVWTRQQRSIADILTMLTGMRQDMDASNPFLTAWPAMALREVDETETAWRIIESASQEVQNSASVSEAKGQLYENEGEIDSAITAYTESLEKWAESDIPSAARVAADLSRVFESQGNYEQAIALRKQALLWSPGSKWNLYALAQLYKSTGDLELAKEYVEDALKLDSTNPSFLDLQAELESATP
jgi:tetratricopeptide (TPR) repeat protein